MNIYFLVFMFSKVERVHLTVSSVDANQPKRKEKNKMSKYKCSVCGYVYNPKIGDPENGVAAGTAFEDLPEDWVCPECGAGKDIFEKQ